MGKKVYCAFIVHALFENVLGSDREVCRISHSDSAEARVVMIVTR